MENKESSKSESSSSHQKDDLSSLPKIIQDLPFSSINSTEKTKCSSIELQGEWASQTYTKTTNEPTSKGSIVENIYDSTNHDNSVVVIDMTNIIEKVIKDQTANSPDFSLQVISQPFELDNICREPKEHSKKIFSDTVTSNKLKYSENNIFSTDINIISDSDIPADINDKNSNILSNKSINSGSIEKYKSNCINRSDIVEQDGHITISNLEDIKKETDQTKTNQNTKSLSNLEIINSSNNPRAQINSDSTSKKSTRSSRNLFDSLKQSIFGMNRKDDQSRESPSTEIDLLFGKHCSGAITVQDNGEKCNDSKIDTSLLSNESIEERRASTESNKNDKQNSDSENEQTTDPTRNTSNESSNGRSTLTNRSSDICRICQEGSNSQQTLKCYCKCKGTINRIHPACLENWLTISQRKTCELCGYEYMIRKVLRPLKQWKWSKIPKLPIAWILFAVSIMSINVSILISGIHSDCQNRSCMFTYMIAVLCTMLTIFICLVWIRILYNKSVTWCMSNYVMVVQQYTSPSEETSES